MINVVGAQCKRPITDVLPDTITPSSTWHVHVVQSIRYSKFLSAASTFSGAKSGRQLRIKTPVTNEAPNDEYKRRTESRFHHRLRRRSFRTTTAARARRTMFTFRLRIHSRQSPGRKKNRGERKGTAKKSTQDSSTGVHRENPIHMIRAKAISPKPSMRIGARSLL